MLSLPTIPLICLIILAVIVLGLLIYYLAFYGRFAFRKEKKTVMTEDLPPISIVIVARDESHHLIKSLPLLLTQDYPKYEVVLVNDNSRDETPQLAIEMNNKYHNLHYVNMSSSISNIEGKKFPLAIGIQAAQYEYTVFTDASCIPSSPYWLQHMAARFVRRTSVVLGHATYEKAPGFTNRILHYDALVRSVQAFSYTIAKMPVMADGRNMAYDKQLFFKNKEQYFRHARLPFGEDCIFVNEVVKRDDCDVVAAPEAVIEQYPVTFSKWFRLKRFELVSRSYYRFFSHFLLVLYNWLGFLFYPAAIAALILLLPLKNWIAVGITAGLIVFKIFFQYLTFGKAAKKLNERSAVPLLFIHDLFFILLQPWIYLASKFEKSKWS